MTSELLKAIERGDLQAATAALDRGADVEEPDMHGCPGLPLRMACFRGHNAIVALLLRRGADIDRASNDGPSAPLRLAVRGKQTATIRLLLERGAKRAPGLELELSLEEITKAEIVAEFNQQAAAIRTDIARPAVPDETMHEVLLRPDEFEALFGKDILTHLELKDDREFQGAC